MIVATKRARTKTSIERQITLRFLEVMYDHVGPGRPYPYKKGFAETLGMTHQEMNHLENGRSVTLKNLIALNRVTGASFDWLMIGKGSKYK